MKYTEEQIKCLRDNYPISNYQEIEKSLPQCQVVNSKKGKRH